MRWSGLPSPFWSLSQNTDPFHFKDFISNHHVDTGFKKPNLPELQRFQSLEKLGHNGPSIISDFFLRWQLAAQLDFCCLFLFQKVEFTKRLAFFCSRLSGDQDRPFFSFSYDNRFHWNSKWLFSQNSPKKKKTPKKLLSFPDTWQHAGRMVEAQQTICVDGQTENYLGTLHFWSLLSTDWTTCCFVAPRLPWAASLWGSPCAAW